MVKSLEISLVSINLEELRRIVGTNDENLKTLEHCFDCSIAVRGDSFIVSECKTQLPFDKIQDILNALLVLARSGYEIRPKTIMQAVTLVDRGQLDLLQDLHKTIVGKTLSNRKISPKSLGQLWYAKALENFDIVFGIGPAGTGKTYLAVAYAVEQFRKGKIKKIILTRPAVEAGESLGFLPGDLKEKADPYLRPLYDALDEMLGHESVEKMIEKGTIEIAPLAYMRGRTLEDSFVILDEGQNTTSSQLKMFLTRLGASSQMVITGDITQIDLPRNAASGLVEAENILGRIKDIAFIKLGSSDVTRHPLVQDIIDAYDYHTKKAK